MCCKINCRLVGAKGGVSLALQALINHPTTSLPPRTQCKVKACKYISENWEIEHYIALQEIGTFLIISFRPLTLLASQDAIEVMFVTESLSNRSYCGRDLPMMLLWMVGDLYICQACMGLCRGGAEAGGWHPPISTPFSSRFFLANKFTKLMLSPDMTWFKTLLQCLVCMKTWNGSIHLRQVALEHDMV